MQKQAFPIGMLGLHVLEEVVMEPLGKYPGEEGKAFTERTSATNIFKNPNDILKWYMEELACCILN